MNRKEIVTALGEHLGVAPVYLGTPSFAYEVGNFTIDVEGNILNERGDRVELEEILKPKEENFYFELELPMEGHTGKTLKNIINMIYSKQPLIKKALGLEENMVDKDFVIKINEADINSLDSFEKALGEIGKDGCQGLDFDFQNNRFVFKYSVPPSKSEAAWQLFALINKNAKKQDRALAKIRPTENEKYTFRTWLLRLGMIGDKYKEVRKVLLEDLSGDSAYKKPGGRDET